MKHIRFAFLVLIVLVSTSAASTASCKLQDAIYKSGEYTLRFSAIPDNPLYEYSISIKGSGLEVIGDTTIPNGFARPFYSIGPQGNSERMGAIYFVWMKSKGNLTEDYAQIDGPAPLAAILSEFSRTTYYTQRDKGAESSVPPTDLLSFIKCAK